MRSAFPSVPGYASLLGSEFLTILALMVGHVAVPWWIAQHGGAADLARYGSTMSMIAIAAMPLLSPLGDRHAKRVLIMAALLGLCASASLLAWWSGARGYDLPIVLAIQSVPMMGLAVFQPASSSYAAELVPASELASALGWQQSAQSAGRMIGPALGGAVLAAAGTSASLWLYASLLALATAFAWRLPATRPRARNASAGWWADIRGGIRANWLIPLERGWTASNFVSWIFLFPCFTLLVPLKVQSLHLSGLWLGLCEASLAIGTLAGALGGSLWLIARFGRFNTRVTAAALQGVAFAVTGLARHPAWLVAPFALAGFMSSAMLLVGLTHRTLARPIAYRARMAAAAMMAGQVAATIGPAVAGAALVRWPVGEVYVAFALLGGLSSLLLAVVPGFRAFMALEHTEIEGWYGKVYPQAFVQPAASAR